MTVPVISLHIGAASPSRSNSITTSSILLVVIVLAGAAGAVVLLRGRRRGRISVGATVIEFKNPADGQVEDKPSTPGVASPSTAEPSPNSVHSSRGLTVFLSYRREDSADVAGRIYDRLTQAFGQDQVFKDVDSIPLGVDFRQHLQQVVGRCDVLLSIMGNHWFGAPSEGAARRLDDPKDFVRIELEGALQRDIPVIPVLVGGASVPQESELPSTLSALAYRNGIAVRADPDFHRDMDRLIEGVRRHVASD